MIPSTVVHTRPVTFKATQPKESASAVAAEDTTTPAGASFAPKRKIISMEEHHSTGEEILRLNPIQKFNLGAKNILFDVPKSIIHGLQGDKENVKFHNLLQMAIVPYVTGGIMLSECFRQGGAIQEWKKQGSGVAFYYAANAVGNSLVDSYVNARYGIDLNLAYKASDGNVHKVFESLDFTRWDLLEKKDWDKLGKKFGIPEDVPDRDTAIRQEVGKVLRKARAWKLVVGATFAAVGTGWVAKQPEMADIGKSWPGVKAAFQNLFKKPVNADVAASVGAKFINAGNKFRNFGATTLNAVKADLLEPIAKSFSKSANIFGKNLPVGPIALTALVAAPLLAAINISKNDASRKTFVATDEAMPIATKVDTDKALKEKLTEKMNPNSVDYEALYSNLAVESAQQANQTPKKVVKDPNASPFADFIGYDRAASRGV